jgi:hypothetical protein
MRIKLAVTVAFALACIFPMTANAKKKKVQPRGMLESMQSVPCGAKQRGLAGVGSIWASVGVTHVNSTEKLCPQYLVRTDDMDYEIRPKDMKHPEMLPIGQEVEIKLKKDHMDVRLPDGGKTLSYIVVSMQPANQGSGAVSGAARPTDSGSSASSSASIAAQPTDRKPPEKP